MGKIQLSKGEPLKTINYPFLVFFPNHLFLPEIGWGSYCMGMGRVWEKNDLGRAPILEKCVLTSWEKNPKLYANSTIPPHFSLTRVFGAPVHSPFTFFVVFLIFPMDGKWFC